MAAAKPTELTGQSAKQLDLSPEVQSALADIQAELADAYRESFTEMVRAIQEQASALNRIQNTLSLLLQHFPPTVAAQAPPVLRVSDSQEHADLASAVVVADPIGHGFTMSLTSLAKAIGVSASDLGVVVKALKLNTQTDFAVVCRTGKHNAITNYHPKAVDAFRKIIQETALSALSGNERSALQRLKGKLGGRKTAIRRHVPTGR